DYHCTLYMGSGIWVF
nr:immunoglobulin light chain junction region [Macaca mulatta]MOW28280.1 immunoglobulin light chain junction region [Macaca mulatta]MOW29099.1 immunoglobulin light chain junction region [Macaca mulatta]